MNFLGEQPTGAGLLPEQEEKLDAITVEPTGEVKFSNGVIIDGNASEIKTLQTIIEDDILQINRSGNSAEAGITIKNDSDSKYANILNTNNNWYFTSNSQGDDNIIPLANLNCSTINNVNVQNLQTSVNNHIGDANIHAPINDNFVSNTTLYSSLKVGQLITPIQSTLNLHTSNNQIHAELDDLQTSAITLWSSDKVNTELTTLENKDTAQDLTIQELRDDFDAHRLEAIIHSELNDAQVSLSNVWSASKISSELKNNADESNLLLQDWITNNFDPHVNNLSIHRELNDAQTTTTNLWSAGKINTEIGNAITSGSNDLNNFINNTYTPFETQTNQTISDLETTATRNVIQDVSTETKIELTQPELSMISTTTKIKSYDVQVGQIQYEWDPIQVSGPGITLSNNNTTLAIANQLGYRDVRGASTFNFQYGTERKLHLKLYNIQGAQQTSIGFVDTTIAQPIQTINFIPNLRLIFWTGSTWILYSNTVFTNLTNLGFPNISSDDQFIFDIDASGNFSISRDGTHQVNVSALANFGPIPNDGSTWTFIALDFGDIVSGFNCDILPVGSVVPTINPIDIFTVDSTGVNVSGDLFVSGDLKIGGNSTEVNTENITVEDPLVKIANGNVTNVLNSGIYMTYNDAGQKYSGLIRDASTGIWTLFNNDSVEPTVDGLPSINLGYFKTGQVDTQFINSNDPGSDMVFTNGANIFELRSNNTTVFTTGDVIVNNVVQDTKVSAFGQYYVTNQITAPQVVNVIGTWDSAFNGTQSSGLNMGYNNATNTFTINHDGTYRISYSVCLRNTNDDNDQIIVEILKNGVAGDLVWAASRSRIIRQRDRIATMSKSFIADLVNQDTLRMRLVAQTDAGVSSSENVDILDIVMNVERLHLNS